MNESISPDKARELIKEIFNNCEILFNNDFDSNFSELKPTMQSDFIQWCAEVVKGNIPHTPITHKKYRDWVLFIDKLADKRVLVVKIKNKEFIEVHLGSHYYYDEQRKRFGIKKGNKYY